MSTILVTGANGFVGSHMVPALVDAGHRVLALVRDDDGADQVMRRLAPAQRDAVETRVGDVTKPETLPARPRRRRRGPPPGRRAARLGRRRHAPPRQHRGDPQRPAGRVGRRRAPLRAPRARSGVVDDPDLHYGSSKVKAMALVRESGLDWTILSPSLLFGPRDGFFNILGDLVRMSPGIVPITGKGDARFQPLAIGDLARAAVLALGDETTIGREFLLGGPRYWTYREIVEEVLRGMGKKRALVPMPVALIRLVATVAEKIRLPFPVATDQLRQLKHDNIGPLDSVRGRLRVRAAADGGRADAPAPEAQGPGAGSRRGLTPADRPA